jgi:hypothetical protein
MRLFESSEELCMSPPCAGCSIGSRTPQQGFHRLPNAFHSPEGVQAMVSRWRDCEARSGERWIPATARGKIPGKVHCANAGRRVFGTSLCAAFALLAVSVDNVWAGNGATEFWLAPPDVSDLNNVPGGVPIYLTLTSIAASTVTIDQPANGSFTPIVVNLGADGWTRVNLSPFKTSLETRPTNTITNTGLHITATTPVTAIYEVANSANSDTWSLKGPDALGQEFVVPLHKHAPFFNEPTYAAPHQAFASFDIVATQNSTQVTIYSPTPLDGHQALTQFSLTLNRGQAYSAGFTGTNWQVPFNHPSGAVVLADKPIAVSIKDDSVHNPSGSCTDLLGDQLVPVNALGTDYVAIKGAMNSNGDESVILTATQNATQVFLDGNSTPAITMFAGETFRVDMDYLAVSANNAVHVHASKPVYAAHISGNGCTSGVALLPRLNLAGSQRVDFVRRNAANFSLMLIAPSSAIGTFAIAGAGTATISSAAFVSVPGTAGNWSAARIPFDTTEVPTDTAFHVTNSGGRFALGILSGEVGTSEFAYLSDFSVSTGLVLTASAAPSLLPEPGGPVTFSVHVVNSGEVAAELAALVDNIQGNIDGLGDCRLPQSIAPSASYDCSFARNVSGNAGDVQVRTITASGSSLAAPLFASGSASVTITDVLPTLVASYQANPGAVLASGGSVTFSVQVDNTDSAEPVLLESLIDDLHGDLNGQGTCVTPQAMAIGGSYVCAFTTFVSGAAGTQTSTMTVTATDDELNAVIAQVLTSVAIGDRIFFDSFD